MRKKRNAGCRSDTSHFFFDELASQRYYLPISSTPHRKGRRRFLPEKRKMWERLSERRAKTGFRKSAALFAAD